MALGDATDVFACVLDVEVQPMSRPMLSANIAKTFTSTVSPRKIGPKHY
jgi:hypothetical protein